MADMRNAWLAKADTLTEALPYMRQNAGAVTVIKYGGHAMGDDDAARQFAQDVVLLAQVGMKPVIVHGGGPQIGTMLDRLSIKSEFRDGLRVTDNDTLQVAEMVLAGSINKQIVSLIQAAGGKAVGICGKDGGMMQVKPLSRKIRNQDSSIEQVSDLGFVGEPTSVDPSLLHVLAKAGFIPVIAPIGMSEDGQSYNVNADTAAGAIAGAIHARRLLMLTDVAGVLDQDGQLVRRLSADDAQKMRQDGILKGGMIPKVETCLDAVKAGAQAAVILDGRVPHALLLELFTQLGSGTLIGDL
ncbi:MAG: acetylglutamate kinase [Alphaproteobacteria bacterium]